MTDYHCWPLWWNKDDSQRVGDIDLSELPLQKSTVEKLLAWQDRYDQQLNIDDPSASEWFSTVELEEFENEGLSLWKQVSNELAEEYEVSYFSQKRQMILQPDELSIYCVNIEK